MQRIMRDMCVYFAYLNQPPLRVGPGTFVLHIIMIVRGENLMKFGNKGIRWMGVVDMGRGLSDTPVLGGCGWVDHVR